MIVPLDLAALVWRHNYLSPELALGWRLGRHAHECFDGLDQVRIVARGPEETLAALRRLARFPEPGAVSTPTEPRPWDMLFYHQPTGTALRVVLIRKLSGLPPEIRALEAELDGGDPEVICRYQDALTALTERIVTGDLGDFCLISETRYRLLTMDSEKLPPRCPWCLAAAPQYLLESEGRACCPTCVALEAEWLAA